MRKVPGWWSPIEGGSYMVHAHHNDTAANAGDTLRQRFMKILELHRTATGSSA